MASIRKRGKTYEITVSKGYDQDGRKITERMTWRPDPDKTEKQNEKALSAAALHFEEQVKAGRFLDGDKITFSDFSTTWLKEYAEKQLSPSTVTMYRDLLKWYILPAIGPVKLSKVLPRDLNALYNRLMDTPKQNGRGKISRGTVKHVHATVSSIYKTAVRWNVCQDSPADRVQLPKASAADSVKYWTREQAAAFLADLDAPRYVHISGQTRTSAAGTAYTVKEYDQRRDLSPALRLFFKMALLCGCRRGELLALEWTDVDFDREEMRISKSTTYTAGRIITKEPKTATGKRSVSLPGVILDALREWKAEQAAACAALGTAWNGGRPPRLIFTREDGKQLHPSTPYQAFKQIIADHNARENADPLPDIPLHGLRHTSATLLISENVDIRTVAGRLGHAQTSTTLNIYSHALKSKDKAAADLLAGMLQQADFSEK